MGERAAILLRAASRVSVICIVSMCVCVCVFVRYSKGVFNK